MRQVIPLGLVGTKSLLALEALLWVCCNSEGQAARHRSSSLQARTLLEHRDPILAVTEWGLSFLNPFRR